MKHQLKRGFTLIEIVIVLAIAALIMVTVFLAVQGAQRNQRDQVRKDVVNRAKAQMEQAKGNLNGSYPTVAADFANTYMGASSGTLNQTGIAIAFNGTAAGANGAACTAPGSGAATVGIAGTAAAGTVGVCLEAGVNYTLSYP